MICIKKILSKMNSRPYLPIAGSIVGGGAEAATKTQQINETMNIFSGIDAQFVVNVIIGAAIGAVVGFIFSKIANWVHRGICAKIKKLKQRK
jgi:hypothetical protein